MDMPEALEIINLMRVADILIPVVTAVLAIVVMYRYDFTEQRAIEVRQELEFRRGKIKHAE
ncbi:hypothetical protein VCR29J2_650001 [Vibrio coralliirubri]|nr:hypothetical protein VCR29J2_650001 [Vibrio coralliirubri]